MNILKGMFSNSLKMSLIEPLHLRTVFFKADAIQCPIPDSLIQLVCRDCKFVTQHIMCLSVLSGVSSVLIKVVTTRNSLARLSLTN